MFVWLYIEASNRLLAYGLFPWTTSVASYPRTAFASSLSIFFINEKFNLADGVVKFVGISSEMDVTFMFNTCDNSNSITFQSKQKKEYQVEFVDFGSQVKVSNKINSNVVKENLWEKADWDQFLWAVRGRCASFLKN
uniref:Uncharacterized protein n=1 Tax=Acrobeloides nanus TaxID=290746 RepID=A0A914CIH5_9BILA